MHKIQLFYECPRCLLEDNNEQTASWRPSKVAAGSERKQWIIKQYPKLWTFHKDCDRFSICKWKDYGPTTNSHPAKLTGWARTGLIRETLRGPVDNSGGVAVINAKVGGFVAGETKTWKNVDFKEERQQKRQCSGTSKTNESVQSLALAPNQHWGQLAW